MATREARYQRSADELFGAARVAVQKLGFELDRVDPDNGLITFKTGTSFRTWMGQQCSVAVQSDGDRSSTISVACKRRGFQLTDWGEAGAIARRTLEQIDRELQPPAEG